MTEEGFSFNLAPLIPYSGGGRAGGPHQMNQVLGLGILMLRPLKGGGGVDYLH